MSDYDFDQLARAVASGTSRRAALRYLGGAAFGGLLAFVGWPTRAASAGLNFQEEEEELSPGEDEPAPMPDEPAPMPVEPAPEGGEGAPPPADEVPGAPPPTLPTMDLPPLFDLTGLWLAGNRQQAILRQSGSQVIASYPEQRACRAGAPATAVGLPLPDDDVTPVMFEGKLSGDQFTGRLAVCMLVQVTRPHWEMRPMRMKATNSGKALAGTWVDIDGTQRDVSLDLLEDSCRDDQATPASLEAARAALDGGGLDVAFSPNGCTRYRRTLGADGKLSSETITAGGKTLLTWTHTPTESTGQQDMDMDGFYEWKASVKRGAALKDWRVEINRFSPSTKAQTAQEVYTRPKDGILHALWKGNDGSGKLVTLAEFDTPAIQPAGRKAAAASRSGPSAQLKSAPCSIQQKADIVQALRDCRHKGADCMREMGEGATARKLDTLAFSRSFNVICVESKDFVAGVDSTTVLDPTRAIDLYVNRDAYFDPNRSDANRCGTMFHEILHVVMDAPHNKLLEDQHPRLPEVDQIHACEQMCFNPGANKCHCAACLKTKTCDKRCNKFKDCEKPEDLGGLCLCPKRLKWYPKRSVCEAECPSGLACFGFRCKGLDPSCDPPPPTG